MQPNTTPAVLKPLKTGLPLGTAEYSYTRREHITHKKSRYPMDLHGYLLFFSLLMPQSLLDLTFQKQLAFRSFLDRVQFISAN